MYCRNEMKFSMLACGSALPLLVVGGLGSAIAADFDAAGAHAKFVDAFNNRQWDDVKALLAKDAVFHRAKAKEVYEGPDAVVERFKGTIGSPDAWNVKFVRLDSDSEFTGNDGRVVSRGDLAMTAGEGDGSPCVEIAPEGDLSGAQYRPGDEHRLFHIEQNADLGLFGVTAAQAVPQSGFELIHGQAGSPDLADLRHIDCAVASHGIIAGHGFLAEHQQFQSVVGLQMVGRGV